MKRNLRDTQAYFFRMNPSQKIEKMLGTGLNELDFLGEESPANPYALVNQGGVFLGTFGTDPYIIGQFTNQFELDLLKIHQSTDPDFCGKVKEAIEAGKGVAYASWHRQKADGLFVNTLPALFEARRAVDGLELNLKETPKGIVYFNNC